MAKSSSPIRLQKALMDAASSSGRLEHRSTAEQIEYWADVGRKLARMVGNLDFARIQAGFAKVRIEEVDQSPVNSNDVFSRLDAMRNSGELSNTIASHSVCYRPSKTRSGLLDQVHPDGMVVCGQFENGEFKRA